MPRLLWLLPAMLLAITAFLLWPKAPAPIPTVGHTTKTKTLSKADAAEDLEARTEPLRTPVSATLNQAEEIAVKTPVSTTKMILAEGVILDCFGNPLSGVFVEIDKRGNSDARSKVKWNRIPGIVNETDQEGHFLLEGKLADGKYRITALRGDFIRTNLEVSMGSQDIQLRLQKKWRVECNILGKSAFERISFGLYLQAPGGSSNRKHMTRMVPRKDGSYACEYITGNPFGELTLHLFALGKGASLFSQKVILKADGSKTVVPAIDLRSVLQTIQVTVLGPDGEPAENPWASDALGNRYWNSSPRNHLTLVLPNSSTSIEIGAKDCQLIRFKDVFDDFEVQLSAGFEARFNITGAPALPANGYLQYEILHSPETQAASGPRQAAGITTNQLHGFSTPLDQGSYQLQVKVAILVEELRAGTMHKQLVQIGGAIDLGSFEIFDQTGTQNIRFSLSAEQYRAIHRRAWGDE